MSSSEQVTILLAEDDAGHARLVERNLRRAGISNPIVRVADGAAALDFIQGRGEFEGQATPRNLLILLDLNMPVMDGYAVLDALKSQAATRSTPVIVLTTTDTPEEVQRCYDLGCNVFVTKPVRFEAFADAVRRIGLLLGVMAVPPSTATPSTPFFAGGV